MISLSAVFNSNPSKIPEYLNNGEILVYTGKQPESANHQATGECLGKISNTQLAFTDRGIEKVGDWQFTSNKDGEIGYVRFIGSKPDSNEYSEELARMDLSVSNYKSPIHESVKMKSTFCRAGVGFIFDTFIMQHDSFPKPVTEA
jgi:hypothetical protein